MTASEHRQFSATAGGSCDSLRPQINWEYAGPYTFDHTKILKNSQNRHKLEIMPTDLAPGFEYIFRAISEEPRGQAELTIVVVKSPLIARINRGSGLFSVKNDLHLNSKRSHDPDHPQGSLDTRWFCLENGQECLDDSGLTLIPIENLAEITIPKERLRVSADYRISLEVSKDRRISTTAIRVEITA